MRHKPVLLNEVIEALNLKSDGIYLDGTLGYGGHAEAILKRGVKKLIGLDRDEDALKSAKDRLESFKNTEFHHASYAEAHEVIDKELDGILLDLGASSPQFDDPERGFSLKQDGPLDMRFDIGSKKTAADILNTYRQDRLIKLIREYGEERHAAKIAKAIVRARREKKFSRTFELKELIEKTIPRKSWPKNIHPATRTFQALRIEVNNELEILKKALPILVNMLKAGGRIAVISFHSLEDRIVKQAFRLAEKSCVCPKEIPVCRCDKEQTLKVISKKPIQPTKTEIKNNVRSRSAKLRVAERL